LEKELGFKLPRTFRNNFLNLSRHVEFNWFTPKDHDFPEPFHEIFCGDLHWSVEITRTLNKEWNENIQSLFPDRSNPYNAVWHEKLAFYEVGNGDYLALDLQPETYEQIVYLSHDGSGQNGYVLAANFEDLLDRWVPLACPGGEDWQWMPFTNDGNTSIDPNSENGREWQKLLGI
jgi:hypothetical protein